MIVWPNACLEPTNLTRAFHHNANHARYCCSGCILFGIGRIYVESLTSFPNNQLESHFSLLSRVTRRRVTAPVVGGMNIVYPQIVRIVETAKISFRSGPTNIACCVRNATPTVAFCGRLMIAQPTAGVNHTCICGIYRHHVLPIAVGNALVYTGNFKVEVASTANNANMIMATSMTYPRWLQILIELIGTLSQFCLLGRECLMFRTDTIDATVSLK